MKNPVSHECLRLDITHGKTLLCQPNQCGKRRFAAVNAKAIIDGLKHESISTVTSLIRR